MFTVYHSNQIDVLKSLLAELIRANPLKNPLEQEQILVQSPGMSQWLKIELARELGIAANISFPLPATFIWDMFGKVLDDIPEKSAFNKESMVWKLMQILPFHLDNDEFRLLSKYLTDDNDGSKLYQLCEKIADIFDGYLVYRPDWIACWEQGQDVAELGSEQPWQKSLWQALYDHTVALGQSPYHRANLYEEFIERLESPAEGFDSLPERLFVFGISSLPPRYMDALAALGRHTDVHLMFTNPCRYYWGEVRDRKYLARLADQTHTDVVGNGLLASMGKLGRDNIFLLSQLSSYEIEAFSDVNRDSLLHHIQADILNLEERQDDENLLSSHHKLAVERDDNSLTLHGCHSPMREVEVLHDRLLEMFEENPDINPRDVIVMVADINAYSAAISAVFGNAPGDRYIPYSVSDRTASQESPLLNAFMQLMVMPESRYSASQVLELLETPEIMARFSITETEFDTAKRWVEETGVRWGLDKETGAAFDLPQQEQNTWLFGIRRMLMGYAMHQSSGVYSSDDFPIAPYNEVQGMEATLAGKLAYYIDTLSGYQKKLVAARSAQEWQSLLLGLMEDFFSVDLEGELALKTVRDVLAQFTAQLEDARYSDPIPHRVMTDYLESRLSGSRVSQRFLAGQVNFCTLMPMRSIPFRVVCLLGMNDGVYPRSTPPEGLDLMNGRYRPGDRSRRDDDRYLFLEALLSAQDRLYISYVSRSVQDNSERAASILVSELLEYCGQNFCLDGDEESGSDESAYSLTEYMTMQYPLTPFSDEAFGPAYRSYAREWLPAARKAGKSAGSFIETLPDYREMSVEPDALPLAELQRFWRLPVRYFFNRRLKVFFEEFSAATEDDEPFALDNLSRFYLKDELSMALLESKLNKRSETDTYKEFILEQRARGGLPVATFGEIELESNLEQSRLLVEALYELCQSPEEDIETDLSVELPDAQESVRLTGWLSKNYTEGLVRYRSGRVRSQDLMAAWIDHLCMCASGHARKTHVLGLDNKTGLVHKTIQPVNQSDALRLLGSLLHYYFSGLNQPLAYFPATALAGIERKSAGKDDHESKMEAAFNDTYMIKGEGSDVYINRVWPEWSETLCQQVSVIADELLSELLLYLRE